MRLRLDRARLSFFKIKVLHQLGSEDNVLVINKYLFLKTLSRLVVSLFL
jgi:hypothetical protein